MKAIPKKYTPIRLAMTNRKALVEEKKKKKSKRKLKQLLEKRISPRIFSSGVPLRKKKRAQRNRSPIQFPRRTHPSKNLALRMDSATKASLIHKSWSRLTKFLGRYLQKQ